MTYRYLMRYFGALAMLAGTALQGVQAQVQFPIETTCKEVYNDALKTRSYGNIIAETHHYSCAGKGKNAWLTKHFENGDIICTEPFGALYSSWRNITNGYDTTDAGWSPNCPFAYNNKGVAVTSNTTKMTIKPSAISVVNIPPRYISIAVDNYNLVNGKPRQTVKIPDKEDYICDYNNATAGRIFKDHGIHLRACDTQKIFDMTYYHWHHIKVPEDIEYRVNMMNGRHQIGTHFVTKIYFENRIYAIAQNGNQTIIPNMPLVDIRRPTMDYETICDYYMNFVPTDYRIIANLYSRECVSLIGSIQNNAYLIKKLNNVKEVMCMPPISKTILGQTIPISYSKIADIYSEECFPRGIQQTTGLPNNNAWQLQRIIDF